MHELKPSLFRNFGLVFLFFVLGSHAGISRAQDLVANDISFGVPYGLPLAIEPYGVLENDSLDGENAGENGVSAELVEDVIHGTLALNPDGSFSYTPGASFDGLDSFVYRAVFGTVSAQATVVLTACSVGQPIISCWNETAFLTKAAEFGFHRITEGFEDDTVWGAARSPSTASSVLSQGIRWETNHSGSPTFNEITTGQGPARTGLWGVYDPEHGYATGVPSQCDVDTVPPHCLYHDGFSGTLETGLSELHGVGGYVTGFYGANVAIALDGAMPMGGGPISGAHQFFGVIDTSQAGFSHFEFREMDGKVGQALYIFGDDFTLLGQAPSAVDDFQPSDTRVFFAGASPNPSNGQTTLKFTLTSQAQVQLVIYDQRGHLVRPLVRGFREAGTHDIFWNGRDRTGRNVAAGNYFGRLVVTSGPRQDVRIKKILIMH